MYKENEKLQKASWRITGHHFWNFKMHVPVDNHTTNSTSATGNDDTLTGKASAEDKVIVLHSCFLEKHEYVLSAAIEVV